MTIASVSLKKERRSDRPAAKVMGTDENAAARRCVPTLGQCV